ncbi:hypothetical protein [Neobacillus sp. D3-1R]|uniref:hypothetical protein n=1 Tax=Neobacillus sp. D3-1R TaxID=3445778 RepID=UPI003F9ED77D
MFRHKNKLIIPIVLWLLVAIGFGFFGLLGFITNVAERGFRTTVCGSLGCTNVEYILSIAWIVGMVLLVYILPILVMIYLFLKRNNKK